MSVICNIIKKLICREHYETWPLLLNPIISFIMHNMPQLFPRTCTFLNFCLAPASTKYILTSLLLKMFTHYHLQSDLKSIWWKISANVQMRSETHTHTHTRTLCHHSMHSWFAFNLLTSITHISPCFLPSWGERTCNTSLILDTIWGEWLVNGKQHDQSWDGSLWFITMCFL